MQLKEKKSSMERDKRKIESELERQRQTIGKQVFLQVVSKRQAGEQSETLQQPNMTSSPTQPIKQIDQLPSSPNLVVSPLSVDSSQNTSLQTNKEKESSRRQWDKSKKNFDLENETGSDQQKINEIPKVNSHTGGVASSSSSLSTPSSAASQSPSNKDNKISSNNNLALDPMSVDLSKAYYSRDEMIKAIEVLKDRYVRESSAVAELSTNNNISSPSNLNNNSTSMVKDIETLNSKLMSLQNEINRLTLLQQKQYEQQKNEAHNLLSKTSNNPNTTNNNTNNSANNSFNLIDDRKVSKNDKQDSHNVKFSDNLNNNNTSKNEDILGNDAFFVSFGTGLAKREKPLALTPKKNLIFIKSIFFNFYMPIDFNF